MATYDQQISDLLNKPGSFQGTPGFQWAKSQGMNAVGRSAAAKGQLGSGNVLTELNKFGTGLAQQDYGNQLDRLTRLSGQQQQYDLGQGQLNLGQQRLGLDTELGRGQLALGQNKLGLDTELGRGDLGLRRELGMGQLQTQRDDLGLRRELGMGQLGVQQGQLGVQRDDLGLRRELGMGQLDTQRADLALRDKLGMGQLQTQRDDLGLRRELGMGQLDTQRADLALRDKLGMGQLGVQQGQLGVQQSDLALRDRLGTGQLAMQNRDIDMRNMLDRQRIAEQRYATDANTKANMYSSANQYQLGTQQNQLRALSDLLGYDVNSSNVSNNTLATLMRNLT